MLAQDESVAARLLGRAFLIAAEHPIHATVPSSWRTIAHPPARTVSFSIQEIAPRWLGSVWVFGGPVVSAPRRAGPLKSPTTKSPAARQQNRQLESSLTVRNYSKYCGSLMTDQPAGRQLATSEKPAWDRFPGTDWGSAASLPSSAIRPTKASSTSSRRCGAIRWGSSPRRRAAWSASILSLRPDSASTFSAQHISDVLSVRVWFDETGIVLAPRKKPGRPKKIVQRLGALHGRCIDVGQLVACEAMMGSGKEHPNGMRPDVSLPAVA
jgi:hypothetical protein